MTASAMGTVETPSDLPSSSPNFLHPVSAAFYDHFQAPDKGEYESLTSLPWLAAPYVTSVGRITKFRLEM